MLHTHMYVLFKGINNVPCVHENRSMIPSLIPSPAKKQPTPVIQARKHPIDAKRRAGNAK